MSRPRTSATIGAVVVLTVLLYALAAGPLVYLRDTGRPLMSDETFAWVYHPLIRAEARIPPLGWAMHWYISLWEPDGEQVVQHGLWSKSHSPASRRVSSKSRKPSVAPSPVTQQAPAAAARRPA